MNVMAAEAIVRARIDAATKEQATEALAAMGLSISDAIRLLLTRVAADREFPFTIKVPNDTTGKAMAELEQGKGKRFDSAEELFKDLGL
jgi:DNA-damage-inducible protein J